ncbi:AcrR family transcriptional regulator [Leifsonia sp. EB41]|uniref:TetR/AcrR family transcriptional regulator n=1 Tax=Leifsonia sp. EB41 TaxID=3156260 RepID=UPI003519A196
MGLRERNAERTRDHVIDVALELFFSQGYEQTTMEQIAERADVGSTTLYRYFPTKDLLLLTQFAAFDWGQALRERPADEPLGRSLALILQSTLESTSSRPETGRLRALIDQVPVARARLWDIATQSRGGLESALADRTGRPADDVAVTMTARMMYQIYEVAFDQWWAGDHSASAVDGLNRLLGSLNQGELILPSPLENATTSRRQE